MEPTCQFADVDKEWRGVRIMRLNMRYTDLRYVAIAGAHRLKGMTTQLAGIIDRRASQLYKHPPCCLK